MAFNIATMSIKELYILALATAYVAVGLYVFWDRYGEELTSLILVPISNSSQLNP
jgi:hypothetical protein